MCGRYTLYKDIEEIAQFLNAAANFEDFSPNYNVAPTHEMPVCYMNENGKRVMDKMFWGFMGWKPKKGEKPFCPTNTRADVVTVKPLWKNAAIHRRCIVPANGFYEWKGSKSNKTPHYIYPKEEDFFGFAGIYSTLVPEGREADKSYSIITTTPNKMMEEIHDRMPVILHPEEFSEWLNPQNQDPDYISDFLKPYPDDAITEHIVSKTVGNVRFNNPDLLIKAELF